MSQKDRAEQLFLSGETIAAVAEQVGVNRRTIERWANEGAWREKRGVVPIAEAKKPKPDQPPRDEVVRVNRRRRAGEIDELELVDIALSDVSAVMGSGEIDAKGIGSCASALCRLIELRLKLKPRSAAELAEMALNLGVNPAEFARELRQAWEKRA